LGISSILQRVWLSQQNRSGRKPSSLNNHPSINSRLRSSSGIGLSKTRTFAFSNLFEAVGGVRTQFMPHHWTVSERDASESTPIPTNTNSQPFNPCIVLHWFALHPWISSNISHSEQPLGENTGEDMPDRVRSRPAARYQRLMPNV
jgi:hypothetical protein